MLTLRYPIAALLLLTVTAARAATSSDEFALVTTRAGTIQFGLVVGETDDLLTLHSLKSQKDIVFGKDDLLSAKRNMDENEAFVQEELPYALAWRLSKAPLRSADRSQRQGRLAIVPFAIEAGVATDGLAAFQTNLATLLSQRKIEVVDPGQVQKALTDLSVQDPLTPPVLPLGKTLKSDWVFTGTVVSQGKVRTLHYRLIDVQSERTLIAGAKPLPIAGQAPTTGPVTPERKIALAPTKAVDLAGKWQIHTSRNTIAVTITLMEDSTYLLRTSGVYAREYRLHGNTLTMTKAFYKTYAANASEMMVWRLRRDGSLMLLNTKWAGYSMTRNDSDQPEPAHAPESAPPAK